MAVTKRGGSALLGPCILAVYVALGVVHTYTVSVYRPAEDDVVPENAVDSDSTRAKKKKPISLGDVLALIALAELVKVLLNGSLHVATRKRRRTADSNPHPRAVRALYLGRWDELTKRGKVHAMLFATALGYLSVNLLMIKNLNETAG